MGLGVGGRNMGVGKGGPQVSSQGRPGGAWQRGQGANASMEGQFRLWNLKWAFGGNLRRRSPPQECQRSLITAVEDMTPWGRAGTGLA